MTRLFRFLRESGLRGIGAFVTLRDDLRRAILHGADLKGADLRGAIVTDERLAQAKSLEGAMLSDGTKYAGEAEPAPAELEL